MKNTLKKLAVVIVAVMLFVLCSCSKDESITTKENSRDIIYLPATYDRNITGSDVYNNGWYYEALDNHTNVKVSNFDSTKGATWKVYFTEESLSEEEIEKLKEWDPDIINSGEINAAKYSWIYIYCDINSTNSSSPTTDMLNISYKTQ